MPGALEMQETFGPYGFPVKVVRVTHHLSEHGDSVDIEKLKIWETLSEASIFAGTCEMYWRPVEHLDPRVASIFSDLCSAIHSEKLGDDVGYWLADNYSRHTSLLAPESLEYGRHFIISPRRYGINKLAEENGLGIFPPQASLPRLYCGSKPIADLYKLSTADPFFHLLQPSSDEDVVNKLSAFLVAVGAIPLRE